MESPHVIVSFVVFVVSFCAVLVFVLHVPVWVPVFCCVRALVNYAVLAVAVAAVLCCLVVRPCIALAVLLLSVCFVLADFLRCSLCSGRALAARHLLVPVPC